MKRAKQRFAETFVSKFTVGAFLARYNSSRHRLPEPILDRHVGEFSTIVRHDYHWYAALIDILIQCTSNPVARQRSISQQHHDVTDIASLTDQFQYITRPPRAHLLSSEKVKVRFSNWVFRSSSFSLV
jgi:hypothetical protein